MGTFHKLKILPQYFNDVKNGVKTFEIRKEDNRRFAVGDTALLQEYDAESGLYTGNSIAVFITYVLRDVSVYGLMQGFCIFGFKIIT